MNAHEVLVRARNLIEREGWGQGCFGSNWYGYGGVCASNAISDAAGRAGVECAWGARVELREVIGAAHLGEVFDWNDAPGRTKEEVLAAFDEAIRRTAPPPADPLPRESYEDYCERTRREWSVPA